MLTYKNGKWSGYENTSLPTNAKTDYPTSFTVEVSDKVVGKVNVSKGKAGTVSKDKIERTWTTKGSDGKVYATDKATGYEGQWGDPLGKQAKFVNKKASEDMPYEYKKLNKTNELTNSGNAAANAANKKKNAVYDKIVAVAKGTQGGDYLTQKANLEKLKEAASQAGFDSSNISSIFDSYNDFYKQKRLSTGMEPR